MARVNPVFKSPLYSNPNRSASNIFSPPSQSAAKKPKSISIPVRFVDSQKAVKSIDPSVAASKIQKTFRGFLVRKNLKTVRKIEEDVNEIDLKLKRSEEMDRLVRDEKERIKIGEMLMRFLFRLDSVRGVRDYRKKVIKRIISIQEMLDSIANKNLEPEVEEIKSVITEEISASDNMDDDIENAVDSLNQSARTEGTECAESNKAGIILEGDNAVGESMFFNAAGENMEIEVSSGAAKANVNDGNDVKQCVIIDDVHVCEKQELVSNKIENVAETIDQRAGTVEALNMDGSKNLDVDDTDWEMTTASKAVESKENQNGKQIMESEDGNKNEKRKMKNEGDGEELRKTDDSQREKRIEADNDNKKQKTVDENEKLKVENDKMKSIMESMMVENEKLKDLVAELCARSAQQCKLMGGIAERVENLEKAVKKMKKKGKKTK